MIDHNESEFMKEQRALITEAAKRNALVGQHVHDHPDHPSVEGGYRGASTVLAEAVLADAERLVKYGNGENK